MAEMTAMDKKYQAVEDARTMMRAVEISRDKARYTAALNEIAKRKKEADRASSILGGLKNVK